jgi:phage shock protein A
MRDSNKGKEGLDSLRINGSKLDNLPLGQGEQARLGLADFLKTDKETKENNIKAKYPKVSEEYINGTIKELRANIKRVREMKSGLKNKIAEYNTLITQGKIRDAQIELLNKDNPEDAKKIRELLKQFPPYNIQALEDQISQFEESIKRCDAVIDQEHDSIAEFNKNLALVQQRDRELRSIK